jgi:tRNA A-37 threonylcarbamoyl transferase component Bud32
MSDAPAGKQTTAALPQPGTLLSDKYSIVRVVGEGGMGTVFEALHRRIKQRVAIKVLNPTLLHRPEIVQRFEREARAAARLRSRHAAKVLDVDETAEGLPYMVMEFLEGRELANELERRTRLPVDEAVDVLLQACSAMAEAHDLGIVHRDLKPANLFLTPEEGRTVVRVLDFGISKMTDEGDASVTATATQMGTPLYMSPEQVRSSKNVDRRTDIWSLGVIAFELLSGRTPFCGDTPSAAIASIAADPVPSLRALREDVPEELERVVLKALSKDMTQRHPDVRAFAGGLAPFAPAGASSRVLVALPASLGATADGGPEGQPLARTELSPSGSKAQATAPGWTQGDATTAPRRARRLAAAAAGVGLAAVILTGAAILGFGRKTPAPAASAALGSSPSIEAPPGVSAVPSDGVPAPPARGADEVTGEPKASPEESPSAMPARVASPRVPAPQPAARNGRSTTTRAAPTAGGQSAAATVAPSPLPAPTTPPNRL